MIDSALSNLSSPVESHIFLTNTALVLTMINLDGKIRMREIAQKLGITEQAVQTIVDHLIVEGYVTGDSSGERNIYQITRDRVLGFPFADCPLSALLALCESQD